MSIADRKAAARKSAFERRKNADTNLAKAANEHLLNAIRTTSGSCVSGYWPIRTEIDPRPAFKALTQSHKLCLPVVEGSGLPLRFRLWSPNTRMIEGAYGASIPETVTEALPNILIVPMAAFDAYGFRLGYGGGFYDRTLEVRRENDRITAIGFAYDIQECDRVPRDKRDQQLDLIVTERGIRTPIRHSPSKNMPG